MPVTLEIGNSACLVRLEGDLGIADAAQLKATLLQALESGRDVHIDMASVSEAGVNAWQLLRAAVQSAQRRNVNFEVITSIPKEIETAWQSAGMSSFLSAHPE